MAATRSASKHPSTVTRARHVRRDDYSGTPRRILGLDGMRAIAVTAVVIFHLGLNGLPGGYLGVDVFFVISGFLITTLLLAERSRRGRIALGAFYIRRARRLIPPLVLVLLGTAVLVATVARDSIRTFLRDVPAAGLYVSNWWYIGHEESYFERIGRGNMLAHLWSLAVEEQFYILWPVLLIVIAAVAVAAGASARKVLLWVSVGGAVASTVWMAYLSISRGYPIDVDPSRAYFGTDTHSMALLVGAALAALWRPGNAAKRLAGPARATLGAVGAAAVVAMILVMVNATEYSEAMYRGGFLAFAALVALVLALITHPASDVGKWLDNAPMRWIGERSYGIYLWHWPIFLAFRPGIDVPFEGMWFDAVRVGVVVALAAASYRYVETPVRNGALAAWWNAQREARRAVPRTEWPRGYRQGVVAASVGMTALVLALTVGVPTASDQEHVYGDTEAVAGAGITAGGAAAVAANGAESHGVAAWGPADVALYGDSVSLWSADALEANMPGVGIDAAQNRSPGNLLDAVGKAVSDGSVRPIVIMQMGAGGPIRESLLRDTIDAMDGVARVVLVGSTANFAYIAPNNALMAKVAGDYDTVVYLDWPDDSAGHRDWFDDGLHLSEAGKPFFAEALNRAALG